MSTGEQRPCRVSLRPRARVCMDMRAGFASCVRAHEAATPADRRRTAGKMALVFC
jgi:hypothetical protein